ncbi:MAG: AraC family transcriptional regulator [Pseudolabrys sp.]|jgi:AraC-like DNA-binding protein
MNPDGFSTARFSTADLPEKDRVAIWREQYGRKALKLDFEPINEIPFECAVAFRALPGVQIMSTAMTPARIIRRREFIGDGDEDLIFIINQTGTATAFARGREVVVREGDALLMSTSEVKVFERHSHGGSLSFRIQQSAVSSVVTNIHDIIMQLIPHDTDILKLLASYAAPLFSEIALATPEFRRTAGTHLLDLIALALGATDDAAELASRRGLPVARLEKAKSYIIENSSRRELSIGTVASHLGVTPRHLQRLFEREDTTFSEFLLAQRLNRAHYMLTQPRLAQSPVATIAYDVGFGDLSYFSRCFKKLYGATPRDIRNRALRSTEPAATCPEQQCGFR